MEVLVCYFYMPNTDFLLTDSRLWHYLLVFYPLFRHYLMPYRLLILFCISLHKNCHRHHRTSRTLYPFCRMEHHLRPNQEHFRLNHPICCFDTKIRRWRLYNHRPDPLSMLSQFPLHRKYSFLRVQMDLLLIVGYR